MNTGELLNALGAKLPRQELYYLEAQGFIRAKKHRIGKTYRREWPEEVIPRLERYWSFREQGFTPRVAWEKAMQIDRSGKEN